ncbi:MAG TPA: mercuric transporter MerT family protein [Nitrosomonas nitrosa]|nr:mercury transporter MerT [Nitrosomonas sp.]HNP51285.1 mercuric transporter MerT family protein [Nitrosomonas nitrosa]
MNSNLQEIAEQKVAEGLDAPKPKQERLLAAGGVLGAVIASSCCIVPLVLVTFGIGGAWVGNLTVLEPYKPYFLGVTAVLLAAGFWHVYFKAKPACEVGSYCARPSSNRITKSALWIATALALLSATVDFWAPFFY